MAAFSDYMELAILNWMRGSSFPAAPATVYVGLFNGDPTDAGTGGAEVTTTIRPAGRVGVTFTSPTDSGGAKQMSNSAPVDFGTAAAGATVTHFALFDAVSGGNMLPHGALTVSKDVSVSDPVAFDTGNLVIAVT